MSVGVIAVDIGGTSIKAIAVDALGDIAHEVRVPTAGGGRQPLRQLDAVLRESREALEETSTLARIGIAVPGLVDTAAGIVRLAANLGWRDVTVRHQLEDAFSVPVIVDNDARVGALAERIWSWPDGGDLAFVPIGTGVSASHSAFGRAVEGATGAAGEFGHLRAVVGGELCTCGNRGCVEAYASAANILARYRARGGSAQTVPAIVAARTSDAIAAQVWEDAVTALSAGLLSLITLLDPSRIIIGGGLSLAGDALLDPVRTRLAADLAWRPVPPVLASALGAHSALVGAALQGEADVDAARSIAQRLADQLSAHVDATAAR
jgi:glucokinase